jgi:hypothetical protein
MGSIEDKMPVRDFVFYKFREMDKAYYVHFHGETYRPPKYMYRGDSSQKRSRTSQASQRRPPSSQYQAARPTWVDTLTALDGKGKPRTDFPPWPPANADLPMTSNSCAITVW